MLSALLAATLTFSATATGVEKGAPIEFVFAAKESDRDYETMFLLTESIDELCTRLEKAGLPKGKPTDIKSCRLWPVGCAVSFEPSLDTYVNGKMPEGLLNSNPIYTGGTRLKNGQCDANKNMPMSFFSNYTLDQSPIVYDGIYPQGAVYNSFTAKKQLKKGDVYTFTLRWDAATMPRSLHLTVKPGQARQLVETLKKESEKGSLDILLGFDDAMTIQEATSVATLISSLDSARLRFNGVTNLFYQSFQPLVKWRDRKERLVQPFELTLGSPDKLVFIEEDWEVEGLDPKLTATEIDFAAVTDKKYEKIDTCFIYTDATTTVGRVTKAMKQLEKKAITNWYVFTR